MTIKQLFVSKKDRYVIFKNQISGLAHVMVGYSKSFVDYSFDYRISEEESAVFLNSEKEAVKFVDECRNGVHDDRIIKNQA